MENKIDIKRFTITRLNDIIEIGKKILYFGGQKNDSTVYSSNFRNDIDDAERSNTAKRRGRGMLLQLL